MGYPEKNPLQSRFNIFIKEIKLIIYEMIRIM